MEERLGRIEAQGSIREQEVETIKESIRQVGAKSVELEKVSLENNLEVQGIPVSILKDPASAAAQVADCINCPINATEIVCSVPTADGPNPVLVIKFDSKSTRAAFIGAGKRFNRENKKLIVDNTHHKIFVNEQLSSDQKRLLYDTKCWVRRQHFKCAWVCNGLVHLKKTDHDQPIIVRSQSQLDQLIRDEAEALLPECAGAQVED